MLFAFSDLQMSALISSQISGLYRSITYYNIINNFFLGVISYIILKFTENYESYKLRIVSIYLYIVSATYGIIVIVLNYKKYKEMA